MPRIPVSPLKDSLVSSPVRNATNKETGLTKAMGLFDEKTNIVEKLKKNLVVLRLLGKGGSASVYMVREKNGDKPYAMKIQVKDTIWDENIDCVNNEIEVLRKLDREGFPFFTQVAMAVQDKDNLYAFLAFEQGGDLGKQLERCNWIFTIEQVRFYFTEIIVGLAKIHSLGYIHRDMKPENILIGSDGHVRIADLGTVARPEVMIRFDAVMTIYYTPPECTYTPARRYDHAIDWWSVGVMIIQCGTGRHPFDGYLPDAERELYSCIRDYEFVKDPKYACNVKKDAPKEVLEMYSLVAVMLELEPEDRLGVMGFIERREDGSRIDRTRKFGDAKATYPADVLSHPFFQFHEDGSVVEGMNEETIIRKGLVPPTPQHFKTMDDAACFPEVSLDEDDIEFKGFGRAADPMAWLSRANEFSAFLC
ncbi:kinase-like protein [Cylindrobasidium torrendii FP15055 ss-10]|uniref:Kinase-like protein n=1 Tax=Cylindrobasidium torrendii FP15055 ss-10 TaxID=1314674 RepID=A0A0D7AZI5_9AGAR|nr:kinase-like protein [Cylindrobasidium torrendii FP15055 ss-10]